MAKPKSSKNETPKQSLKIRPLAGYVVVEPTEAKSKTASGIYLPESAQEKPAQGKVLSVGNSLLMSGMELGSPVQVGDIVLYKKWGGDEIKVDGQELKLVKFDDLIAILED